MWSSEALTLYPQMAPILSPADFLSPPSIVQVEPLGLGGGLTGDLYTWDTTLNHPLILGGAGYLELGL